jgi:hypothetical protein
MLAGLYILYVVMLAKLKPAWRPRCRWRNASCRCRR